MKKKKRQFLLNSDNCFFHPEDERTLRYNDIMDDENTNEAQQKHNRNHRMIKRDFKDEKKESFIKKKTQVVHDENGPVKKKE